MRQAPAWMIARVQAVDPALTVAWLSREGCYAVIQHDDAAMPSLDELADQEGRQLWTDMQLDGYVVDIETCRRVAYDHVISSRIVRRLRDPETKQPITLDNRTLVPLRESAWRRRHYQAKDYAAELDALTYEDQRSRDRARTSDKTARRSDPVYKRMLSDLAWGQRPTRSVHGRPGGANAARV